MKIYLAGPYSDPDPQTREYRFDCLCAKAADLMREGNVVFSPISHSHPIARFLGNHNEYDFWLRQDLAFISWCDELWILQEDGWEESKGVGTEIAEAKRLNIPIKFVR